MFDFRVREGLLWRAACLGAALSVVTGVTPAATQAVGSAGSRYEVFVNSELEKYLRLLQTTGGVMPYPWSIRAFSPRELDHLAPGAPHPWAARVDLAPRETPQPEFGWIRPTAQLIVNSAFPYGFNDGPVWAGRGATLAYQMGFGLRYGRLSVTVAPQVFWAQNAAFELAPTGPDRSIYADGRLFSDDRFSPIDLPQRFGDGGYARIDPGQSTLRLDLPGIAVGLSTANQHWGPADEQPLILGSNAPGYLHGFLGTSSPLDLWIGKVHGRLVWGRLEHTRYAPLARSQTGIRGRARFTSGLVGVFTPRGLPGLELGLARFFHEDWPAGGPGARNFLKPLEAFLKAGLADGGSAGDGSDPDNQLASVFLRWVFPGSGLEVYGEFARNDHSWDLRDFFLEPDHNSGYLLGLRHAWQWEGARLLALRGEVLNTRIGHVHQVRTPQVPFYRHGTLRQGHTHRGQLLGAPAGYGGGGALLAVDYYHPAGRITTAWRRELRQERGNYWWDHSPERLAPDALDVMHSLGVETLLFRGRWDITAGLAGVYNLNRDYRGDVFNLNGMVRVSVGM